MNPVDLFLRWFPGWKAALVAVGQIGLGVHQLTEGNFEAGIALIASGVGVLLESMRN